MMLEGRCRWAVLAATPVTPAEGHYLSSGFRRAPSAFQPAVFVAEHEGHCLLAGCRGSRGSRTSGDAHAGGDLAASLQQLSEQGLASLHPSLPGIS
jgi:hypothetical protein